MKRNSKINFLKIKKLKTFLLASSFALFFFFIIPYVFIKLDAYFEISSLSFFGQEILGMFLVFIGIAIVFYSTVLFFHFGKGTPVPIDPPKKLVAKGLYKYSRNPIYIGYVGILLGEFLIFGSLLLLIYVSVTFLFIHLFIIYYEEPRLRKRFGKSYDEYTLKTPRWL